MINETFRNELVEIYGEMKMMGFDEVELVDEGRETELYFIKENTGIGAIREDLRDDLWKLKKKDLKQLKKNLACNSIFLEDYRHFLEFSRKLVIK